MSYKKENLLKKFKALKIDNEKGSMDIDIMLKKFNKAVEKDGVLKLVKRRSRYESKSEARHRKNKIMEKQRLYKKKLGDKNA
jgi:ribosomal protein S21